MIAFLLVCVFLGIILAGLAAPIIIISNRRKRKQMDDIIQGYHRLPTEEQQIARPKVLHELSTIKATLSVSDRQSMEAARDKLALV